MKSGWKEGEENVNAKVPFETVERIRNEWAERTTLKKLSEKYDVPVNTIKNWIYYDNRVNK